MRPTYYVLSGLHAATAHRGMGPTTPLVGLAAGIVMAKRVKPHFGARLIADFEELPWRGVHTADINGERWCAMSCRLGLDALVVVSRGPTLFIPPQP